MKSINTRFTIIVGLFAVAFSGFIFLQTWYSTRQQMEDMMAKEGKLALDFDLAIRKYVGEHIRPRVQELIGKDEFIPETMSTSYVARNIFEEVRKDFPDYILKFSSDNPRNSANKASPEEMEILEYFRQHPKAKTWVGKLKMNGEEYLGHFSARRVKKSCLQCHGKPADAPDSLIARYGSAAGFDRSIGDVIAMDTVAIPMKKVDAALATQASQQLAILAVGVIFLFSAIFVVFRRVVSRRLGVITSHFKKSAEQDDDLPITPLQVKGNDEITILASSFNAMAARNKRLHESLERRVEDRTKELEKEIIERRRAEQKIRDYAVTLESNNLALEELNKAAEAGTLSKSEFLANMSHEIRTPMTAILGFSEALQENLRCCSICEEYDSCELRRQNRLYIETICTNGSHLIKIINDILDLSKIEAGKLSIENIPCSPYSILSEVSSLMRVRTDEKKISLTIEYEGAIPETIVSDPTRLRQILINLIGNAIKFTDAGEVKIIVRVLDSDTDNPKLEIECIDTGIGMSQDQIAHLFSPFSQADTSTTRKYGGTGLGLTISKRLADHLGGSIAVESCSGMGSTFILTIATGPLNGVKMLENPEEVIPCDSTDNAPETYRTDLKSRVLLAEDGHDNQRLIKLILEKANVEVTAAENGQIAHELALAARDAGNPFDVILMDMQMPIMDGYESTRRLRRDGYTGPIVALTAHAMSSDRQKCYNSGCDDYASKPIDRKKLLDTIARHTTNPVFSDHQL